MTENIVINLLEQVKQMSIFNELRIGYYNLPNMVHGFTYCSSMKNYYIIISDSLSQKHKSRVLLHEIKHVLDTKDTSLHLFELDNRGNIRHLEASADFFMQIPQELLLKIIAS